MDKDLIHRFIARAAAAPDATAVVEGDRAVSYRHLADLSSILARRLGEAGAVPGDVVAILSDRSIEWVVAMLAVLRIGGIYLPLPPDLPRERRLLLMGQARVRHVLRHPAVENDLGDAAVVVDVEVALGLSADGTAQPIAPPARTDADRACVLFTSGTTGMPKGVVVRQSSVVRLVVDTNYIHFDPTDVVAFASNTAFDAVTFEVWGALLNGSRLVVIPSSTLLSPSAFETAIRTKGVTTLFLTTELFNRIARARPTAFHSLKWLIFGGEKANADCVRAVLDSDGSPQNLLHAYGPTECTTFSTCDRITAVPPDATTIPIGTPISGCTIYLLDDQLHPVPNGEEGEICIGGDGVAEGYLHRPQETAAAFTAISIGVMANRIYRTGDRARRRSDGLIEFIGRRDGQIKLRGFRIETAEIEAMLSRHPAVRDAVVLVYPGPGGAPRLGGCLLLNATTESVITDIHAFVAERLPAPMVPARLRGYDAFPLTASKKVDRQQLLADLQDADLAEPADHADGHFSPADEIEKRLAAIWKGILDRGPRRVDESFFEAGGDSLQAVELQLRIENEWRTALSPSLLIETPRFGDIAAHIRRHEAPDVRPVVWLRRGSSGPVLACLPGVYGHVFFFRNLVPLWPAGWGLCALPSRYLAPTCDRRLLTLEEIAEENLARLAEAGGGPVEALAGYSFGGLVAYEMARRLASRGKPPALILYDTAAAGEQFRGKGPEVRPSPGARRAWREFRTLAGRTLYHQLLRYRGVVPTPLFNAALANLVAVERYRPLPYDGEMLLIRSTVAGPPPGVDAETMGWGSLVRGRLSVQTVAAEHGDFFKPPHVAEVAAMTIEYLRRSALRLQARGYL